MESSTMPAVSSDGPSPGSKRPRNRVVISCTECNRRKQKCNREWPCSHCLGRRAAHLCRYSTTRPGAKLRAGAQASHQSSSPEASIVPAIEDKLDLQASTIDGSEAVISTVDKDILEELGYSGTGSGTLLGAFENLLLEDRSDSVNALSRRTLYADPRRSRKEVLKLFPRRQIVDFLIQHYLAEANCIYEKIYPPTFLERYNSWWSQQSFHGPDDIQFGAMILRICANSLQFLPHPNSPTQGIIDIPLNDLEARCTAAACKLDNYRPRLPSLTRVQQLSFYLSSLQNNGDSKEFCHILAESVKEARDINLFLEEGNDDVSEFDAETRRKTFWYLYVWDRFCCTSHGRWPLIPEAFFDIKLPSEAPYMAKGANPDAPTIFTDVLMHIKLSKMISQTINAPAKKNARLDPLAVEDQARKFQEHFVEKLHPAFRLGNPDTRWDDEIPTLPLKRELLWCHIYGIRESMHRGFIGPIISENSGNEPFGRRGLSAEENRKRNVAHKHRETLAIACINILETVKRMHQLLGGGTQRYFVVAGGIVEGGAILGMCLISDLLAMRRNQDSSSAKIIAFSEDLRQRAYREFVDGLALLVTLAEGSSTAQKGLKLLGNLHRMLRMEDRNRVLDRTRESPIPNQILIKEESPILHPGILDGQYYVQGPAPLGAPGGPIYPNVDVMMLGDLESFSNGDFSWFFEDSPPSMSAYMDPLIGMGQPF